MISGKFTLEETNRRIYRQVLTEYLKRIQDGPDKVIYRQWIHIGKLIDSLEMEVLFVEGFDFQEYYATFEQENVDKIQDLCRKKYARFRKNK